MFLLFILIKKIQIRKMHCILGSLTDVSIFISSWEDTEKDGVSCTHFNTIAPSAKVDAACHAPRFGRYVSIQFSNASPDVMARSLCEVATMGYVTRGK